MNVKDGVKRYLVFFAGLFINSFGVSFVTKASMGTSPISSIPYTLSLIFTSSLGTFTLYMSLILIVLQMIILGKNFPKSYLLQIPFSLVFSWFIDCTMKWLSAMEPKTYPEQVIMLLVGCGILGVGVYLEVLADVVMLPGEAFVSAVSKTFHIDFGKSKIVFDSSMAVIAVGIGFFFLHHPAGVREGTVVAAVLVGMIARFFVHKCDFVGKLIFDAQERNLEEALEE